MRIFVSGLINIETTAAVRGFPINYYPIDYPFFGIDSNVSGVGYNIAKALTALGDDVRFYSFIGDDENGERILSRMKKDGIDTAGIITGLKSTPASVVLYDHDGRRQIYCDLKDIQEQSMSAESAKEGLESCDAAVLCNIGFNRELIKTAKKNGTLIATDVHVLKDTEDEYNRDFMEYSDILFLSDEGLPCAPDVFIHRLADRYRNRIIVIGMGDKGAMLFEQENDTISTVPAYKDANVVNTVGAGDALFSSFLHFYLCGNTPVEALKRAVVFAGIKIGFSGASVGFCSGEEVEKHIRQA